MEQESTMSRISGKTANIICFILLMLAFSVTHIESPLYSISYPKMIQYFGVTASQIENLMRFNFIGICIGGLLAGPLSDSYGRKRILLIGLFIHVFTSLGCALSNDFNLILFLRFISGLAASSQLILTMTILFDSFSGKTSAKAVSLFNGGVGLFSIISPMLAGFIIHNFYWKINLFAVNAIVTLTFFGILIFLKETNPAKKRLAFNLMNIFKGYVKIISSLSLICYTIIYKFVHVLLIVCAANLSVIFMKNLNIPAETFGYYQASTPAVFILFSFLCIKIIDAKGLDYTNNLGFIIIAISASALLAVALIAPSNAMAIIIAINAVIAGGSLMNGFIVKAASIFPNMKGASMAIVSTIEYLLIAKCTKLTETFFDGSIMPIAIIIFAFAALILLLYVASLLRNNCNYQKIS